MYRSWLRRAFVGATLLMTLGGCAHQTTTATFLGTSTPVLLGPRDRVSRAATEPLPVIQFAEFESEASFVWKQGSTSTHTYTIEEKTGPYKLAYEALQLTKDEPDVDIRLTMVKPVAYGVFGGMKMSQFVEVEGKVVKVQGVAK